MAVLLIFEPFAGVSGPVSVPVHPFAVELTTTILALIDVAIGEDTAALAVEFVVPPVTLEKGAVWPHLLTIAMPFQFLEIPVSLVVGFALELAQGAGFHLDTDVWWFALIIGAVSPEYLSNSFVDEVQQVVALCPVLILEKLEDIAPSQAS